VEAPIAEAAERLQALRTQSRLLMSALVISVAVLAGFLGWLRIRPRLNARAQVESILKWVFFACAALAILTTIGIIFSVAFETFRFFGKVPFTEFFFGSHWSPQTALRADQVASQGAFGMIPLFTGTLLISAIAMIVAVPVGLLSAIYLSEYAGKKVRGVVKPLLEMLAGIPTVVYGFFAALTVAPFISDVAASIGIEASSQSALAAGAVMGIMIIPFVSSLSDDVINAVPQAMRDGSLALGATQSETMKKVIFPAALPGIMGGILLAVSRAIGETMIVVMAAGLAANLTANPLETVTTVTVQIVTLLTGDQEFDSAKTLAAFALGAMLFLATLLLNVIALKIVRKYREQYD
jgi:phosphate transport system permease protein